MRDMTKTHREPAGVTMRRMARACGAQGPPEGDQEALYTRGTEGEGREGETGSHPQLLKWRKAFQGV